VKTCPASQASPTGFPLSNQHESIVAIGNRLPCCCPVLFSKNGFILLLQAQKSPRPFAFRSGRTPAMPPEPSYPQHNKAIGPGCTQPAYMLYRFKHVYSGKQI
ncbi:hypothetical protein Ancab_017167, partial [Ancistrocladus abbreviatus]